MRENRKDSSELRRRLGTNIKRLRRARRCTQRNLAKLSGFSGSYISNVERGTVNITLANLQELARGLGCTEADLLASPLWTAHQQSCLDGRGRRPAARVSVPKPRPSFLTEIGRFANCARHLRALICGELQWEASHA